MGLYYDIWLIKSITRNVNFYFSAIFVPCGMLLNIATILIFLSKRSRFNTAASNMSTFYIVLAIYDILALSNSILFTQLLPSIGINILTESDALCRFSSVWTRSVIYCPSWIQVFITFDRFRKIVNSSKYFSCCVLAGIGVKHQFALQIMSLQAAFFSLNLNGLTTYISRKNLTMSSNETSPTVIMSISLCVFPQPLALAIDVLNVCLRAYIPFIFMFVMNVVLTRRFLAMNRNISSRRGGGEGARPRHIEINFTRTVIVMDFTFFFLYTPWSIWYVLHAMSLNMPALQTPRAVAYITLFQAITYSISYVNNFTSFFLNFTFNLYFRKRVLRFLKRLRINKMFFLQPLVFISN